MQYLYFAVILGSLINSVFFWKFSCSSSSAHPVQSWNSEKKILDTCVQHCLWGEGKGWACLNNLVSRGLSYPSLRSEGGERTWERGNCSSENNWNILLVYTMFSPSIFGLHVENLFELEIMYSGTSSVRTTKAWTESPWTECLHNLYRRVWNLIFSKRPVD